MNATSATATHTPESRYHSLDALRAVAMLGGILLHALWMYCPIDAGAPVVDSSAHQVPYYLFYTIHTFRMHAFFLIAGFFAHLVYTRRGARVFLRQRIQRIGIPLVLGWIALYPVIHWCKAWGSTVSGAEITGLTTPDVFSKSFSTWSEFSSSFNFMHLWFLYLLLLFYAVTLIGAQTLKSVNISETWRTRGRQAFVGFMESRWNILLLAIFTAAFLYRLGWFGVDTPKHIKPTLGSFVIYWLFFLVGWGLHANGHLLSKFDTRWKTYLTAGLLISLPMFLYISDRHDQGKLTNHRLYPMLLGSEIQDWSGFRSDLLKDSSIAPENLQTSVWQSLPETVQSFIRNNSELNQKQCSAVARQLNRHVLKKGDIFTKNGTPLENRVSLESAFPGRFATSTLDSPSYQWAKAIYSLAYAVASWCFVFGSLGFFRQYFSKPSVTWRYLADASYWMYLLHLPVLFAIEIPMSTWQAHWILKLAILNLSCFAILLLSYQLLVRHSIIGVCLNGRRPAAADTPHSPATPKSLSTKVVTP